MLVSFLSEYSFQCKLQLTEIAKQTHNFKERSIQQTIFGGQARSAKLSVDHLACGRPDRSQTGQKVHPGHVWRILRSLGWSCQRPVGRATRRDEPAILRWKRVRWPEIKKSAAAAANHSVCGCERFERTTAPGAHLGAARPASRAVIFVQLEVSVGYGRDHELDPLFSAFPWRIKAPQVIEFLEQLQRHIGGRLTIIWDGLPVHRSKLVREFVAGQRGRTQLEFLPAYAPELNPVEYIFGLGRTPLSEGSQTPHARESFFVLRAAH